MKTFCIVGGCGYLGYHIGKYLKKDGVNVILFDKHLPHSSWKDDDSLDILEGFTYIKGEVSNIGELQNALSGVDCVIHTAAFGMSGKEQMPLYWEEMEQTNINGTINVINAAASKNVKALVYTSTYNVVFGGNVIRNGDETLPYFPLFKHPDHYSRTKCIGEQLILIANSKCTSNGNQLKTCALRLAGLVGPKEQRHLMRIVDNLKKGLVKIKYGDQNNHVDFVGLQNAVQAHVKAANALLNLDMRDVVGGQAYFISDGVPISNFEFFGAIKQMPLDDQCKPLHESFQGCISTFVVNGEVQPLNGSGSVFRAVVHGKLRSGCVGNVQSQGVAATDPLSVGVTLVIIFFVVLMVAIMVSFIVYRRRRLHREKLGGSSSGGSHHTKQNGTALLATSLNDGSRGHPESAYENGEVITDDVLRSHLVAHDLTAKKHKDRDFTDIPQRPDIIEREVINKSPGMPSLRMEDNSMLNDRNVSTLGDIQDSEAPEHYDLENASSIAPSDIDIVYHYKGYRDGNVRKYKTNPHIPNFHKHNHRHSPHQYHPTSGPVPLGTRNSPHNMLRQSPTALQPRDSPSMLKMQSTPLARLSPSSELSQQTPRILTLQDISGRPLQSALLATSQAAGVKDPMTNSERSLNSPVSQLSHSTSSMQSRNPSGCNIKDKKDRVNGVGVGLTAEEIDRLNSRPRNSSLVSTLDAVSSSSEDHCATKNKLAELLETNTELLEAQDSSTDESGNDSFTCSEFEYENNYDRVAREFGPGNMIFSKLAEVENENDEDSAKNFDGFDSFHGSLSTLVASDDDISNMSSYKPPNGSHLGWDYLLNWGPNFESLVGVFKDIAELPDSTNSKTNPKPGEEYV